MHSIEYCSALKMEILQCVIIWIKCEDILSKINQLQDKYYIIALI